MFYSWNKRSLITFFYYNIDFYTIFFAVVWVLLAKWFFLKCKSFFVYLSFTMIKILTKIVHMGNFSLNLVKKRSYCKNQMLRLLQPLGYFIHIFQNFFYCITYLSINFHLFFYNRKNRDSTCLQKVITKKKCLDGSNPWLQPLAISVLKFFSSDCNENLGHCQSGN